MNKLQFDQPGHVNGKAEAVEGSAPRSTTQGRQGRRTPSPGGVTPHRGTAVGAKFNGGKPYHGSEAVMRGKLKAETDTDYTYFICPRCGDRHVLRILDYATHMELPDNPYNEQCRAKARKCFTLVFHLYCERCGFEDFTKISNWGWQEGQLPLPDE